MSHFPLKRIPVTPLLSDSSQVRKLWGVVIDRLEGGKIKVTRIIIDAFGAMMQFGVFTPPKS
jgi:hypothetical protein